MDDIIAVDLRALIVTINPAARSAEIGHAFSSPGNPFWRLLHASGLTPQQLAPNEERRLLDFGLGLASTVQRATAAAGELSAGERRRRPPAGEPIPTTPRRPARFDPVPALYVPGGSSSGPGLKPERLEGAELYVLPNPSGRNRAYPGFDRKLVWYQDLAAHLARARSIDDR